MSVEHHGNKDPAALLDQIRRAAPEARATCAIALAEAVEAVLQEVEPNGRGDTIEQFRLTADPARLAEAAKLASLSASEARAIPTGSDGANDFVARDEVAMILLSAFLSPGVLRPADLAEVRELARLGESMRASGEP